MNKQNNANIKAYEKSGQYLLASWLMAVGRFSLMAWFICIFVLSSGRSLGLSYDIVHSFLRLSGSLWVVSILLSVGITIPLCCTACGNRIAVITSYTKLSPDYIARKKS